MHVSLWPKGLIGRITAVILVALVLEYISPSLRFWTPWLGATPTTDWDIDGGHMAERSAAFIIIALGESVVVMGATLAEVELDTGVVLAFLASFGASGLAVCASTDCTAASYPVAVRT